MDPPAYRAHPDVNAPKGREDLPHRHAGEPGPEALPPLEGENQFQVPAFAPVVKEAIVTDFLKTAWKHMGQEAPYELLMGKGNDAPRLPGFPPPGGEGDLRLCEGKDPAVGDRDLVGILPQIRNGVAKAIEGLLDVGAPVLLVKPVLKGLPSGGCPQDIQGGGEKEAALAEKGVQAGKEFPLELIPEDMYGDEKVFPTDPELPAGSQPAARDNAVDMDMVAQSLVPGVQDLDDAGGGAEGPGVLGELQESLGATLVEKAVQKGLVGVKEWVQLMGQGKDHMEIG